MTDRQPAATKQGKEPTVEDLENRFQRAVEMRYGEYIDIPVCSIKDLYPHPRNYQEHPAAQLTDLQVSLEQFGQTKPLLVWPRRCSQYAEPSDDGYFVVTGHGLREAALLQGWDALWVRVMPEGMSEDLIMAYIAVDNETSRQAVVNMDKLLALTRRAEKNLGPTMARLVAGGETALETLKGMAGGKQETVADILARYGEPDEADYWPMLKLRVPVDVLQRFNALMRKIPGEDESEKFAQLLQAVNTETLPEEPALTDDANDAT